MIWQKYFQLPVQAANNSFQARPSVRLRLPPVGLNSNVRMLKYMICHSCHKDVDYRDTRCYHCGSSLISDSVSTPDAFKEKAFGPNRAVYKFFFSFLFAGFYLLIAVFAVPEYFYIEVPFSSDAIYKKDIVRYGLAISVALGYGLATFLAKRERSSI